MFKKLLITGILIVTLAMAAFSARETEKESDVAKKNTSEETYAPIVVLELFTSQGCSSCPAADVLLNEVKQLHPKDVYTLSYHVDYWNYIGWQDPFSSKVYSEKQSRYNQKLKYRGNYTPEVVVNGKAHFTGSNRAKMNAAIKTYQNEIPENEVRILKWKQEKDNLAFNYAVEGSIEGKKLRVVLVLDERITEVKRGENRNRTIKNSNIVISENEISLEQATGSAEIDLSMFDGKGEKLSLLLLVSNADLDITAATKNDFVK